MVRDQYVKAAQRYAAADKSDPFTFNRAMTHLANGVAGIRQDDGEFNGSTGQIAIYNANITVEEASSSGSPLGVLGDARTYNSVGFRNMVRP